MTWGTRQDLARCDKGGHGMVWQDLTRGTWQDLADLPRGHGRIWQDLARFDKIWQGGHGKIWYDLTRGHGKIW